jgi:mRNA interferase RelE/StbE
MSYTIEFTPAAAREYRALPAVVKQRVTRKIDALAENPRPHGVQRLRGEPATHRVRVGDYRILYEIHDATLIVLVIRVRNRRDAYR